MANLYDVRVQSGSRLSSVPIEADNVEQAVELASAAGHQVQSAVFRKTLPTEVSLSRHSLRRISWSVAWGIVLGCGIILVLVVLGTFAQAFLFRVL